MTNLSAWKSLISKNLVGKGSVIGIPFQPNNKIYHRFIIEKIDYSLNIQATHIQTNMIVEIDINAIAEIDGMDVIRFLNQADLDNDGKSTLTGKKRGRRSKKTI